MNFEANMDYKKIIAEITKYNEYHIRNPFLAGIKSLSEDKEKVQSYLDRIIEISNKIERIYGDINIEFNNKKQQHESNLYKLLSSDDEVRNQKSESMRTAMANSKMLKEFNELNNIKIKVLHIKNIRDIVNNVRENLISKLMTITNMQKDCILGIATGELDIKVDLSTSTGKIKLKLGANNCE